MKLTMITILLTDERTNRDEIRFLTYCRRILSRGGSLSDLDSQNLNHLYDVRK